MYDAFSRFGVMKDAVSIFVQSWKNVFGLREGIPNLNMVFFKKVFYQFHSRFCHGRRRFVTAAPIGLAVAAHFKEVVLSAVLFFPRHRIAASQK